MSARFKLKSWSNFLLVEEIETKKILGYFMPPQPGEIYIKTYELDEISNLEAFPEHKNVKFFWIYPLELEPLWEQLQFTVEEALTWKHEGKLSAEKAKAWRDAGFDVEATQAWRKINARLEPAVAKELAAANCSPSELKEWLNNRIFPDRVLAWRNEGFASQEARKWQEKKFSPQDAISWKQEKVSPNDAAYWRDMGLDKNASFPWREQGFSAHAYYQWNGYGIKTPEQAKIWRDSGLEFEQVLRWRNAGYTDLEILQKIATRGKYWCPDEVILFWGFTYPEPDKVPWQPEHPNERFFDQWQQRFQRLTDRYEPTELGCKIDVFGRPANICFFYVTLTDSEIVGYEGKAQQFQFPKVQSHWEGNLKIFCQVLGLPWKTPEWQIVAKLIE